MRKQKHVTRFTDYLAPLLYGCPRCGGVGCKECRGRRLFLENTGYGYAPDDAIDMTEGDGADDEDEDDDGVDAIRRKKEREDESFARRLGQGFSMLADADDSVLDD